MGQPNWFIFLLRTFFIVVDYVVYWFVGVVYQLFIMISEAGVFSPSIIGEFAGRIYALLGVFMLFKVSFSLITYILNPDTMTDKSKGLGKLLTNFFVVLIGIVAVPYVFQAAYSLQSIVLEENVVGNLIMGNVAHHEEEKTKFDAEKDAKSYIEQGGNIMSFTTLSAFVRLNPEVVDEECANAPVVKQGDQFVLNDKCTSDTNSMNALNISVNNGDSVKDVLLQAYEQNNTNFMTTTNLVLLKATDKHNNEAYLFDYTIIISTIAGGLLAWLLLLFCIDIALRSVKLGFLQLIAPVPIISYIDPKGQDMFKKWLKECGKTYADLFIRLVSIYFVIFVISELDVLGGYYNIKTGQTVLVESFETLMVKILIIFGALMFAKKLPQLIESLFGFKFAGDFTLSPMNKIQQLPLVGAATTNFVGRTAGAIKAARHDQTGNKWRAAASGWFAAGDALHGKVPLMGAKPGTSTVRAVRTGREAGYEVATGSKMKAHSFVNDLFREDGKNRIDDLKKNYRAPLQQELNDIGLRKQEVANSYNRLNEQLQRASTEGQRVAIQSKMRQAQERYSELASREAKISGDIGTINDQIKDLERAYNIDKSPVRKIDEVKGKVDTSTGRVRAGAYGDNLEPIDYNVSTQNASRGGSTNQSQGGHQVTVRKKTENKVPTNNSTSGTTRVTVKRKNES